MKGMLYIQRGKSRYYREIVDIDMQGTIMCQRLLALGWHRSIVIRRVTDKSHQG